MSMAVEMSDQKEWSPERLFEFLQGCHALLGILWPKPGVPRLPPARLFIGTKAHSALQDGIRLANGEFDSFYSLPDTRLACEVWGLVKESLKQLEMLGQSSRNPNIDGAFNLLYLLTGLLYHQISLKLGVTPTPVARFPSVEPPNELLQDCAWEQTNDRDLENILREVVEEMQKLLALLKDT